MAEITTPHRIMSIEEYLVLERDVPVRHEYVDGWLYAMTGSSRRHNLIAGRIFRKLAEAADGTSCRVYVNDMKVRTPNDRVYYPDIMVVCEPEPEDPYLELEPCLIVEVASPSTANKDRREKLVDYRAIPRLHAYLRVDQDSRHVERYYRGENGEWLHATLIGSNTVPLPCPETELALANIYEGLE